MSANQIENLRKLRGSDNFKIAPSPYLKSTYFDESGNEKPLELRNYQKIGIMNQCMVPKCINGDDTGLGKTIQCLSTIGFVWLKEPDYVPIILTTKSALFQWKAECQKFMLDMEPVVSHGEPSERSGIYEGFFTLSDKKRILLITYDTLFRDLEPAIVKDKSFKPDPKNKKLLKEARDKEKDLKDKLEKKTIILRDLIDGKRFEHAEYVSKRLNSVTIAKPNDWDSSDEILLESAIKLKSSHIKVVQEVANLTELVSPAVRSSGIQECMLDLKSKNPNTKFMLVMDEAHKVKNHKSQVHEKVRAVSMLCDRIIGLTATPVKNRLMEFFGLFRIVNPALFPRVTAFQNEFCVTKMQRISGGRQVPVVVGYKNLDKFVELVEPYYLSRKKHDVAKELPEMISVEIQCELTDLQDQLYDMAENGVSTSEEENPADTLSSLTMCAQAVNAPQLILNEDGNPFEGPSSKVDALVELLTGDAEDQKVIVFSRFEKMVSLIGKILESHKIKYVRVTGKESDPKLRRQNCETFQDLNSGVNVILITMAGSESLNLQAAEHFVFVDLPWSYGDMLQLVGRMIRIGSSHKTVVAHYMLGLRQSGEKTIDHHVLKALKEKMKLADKVAGKSMVNALQFTKSEDVDMIREIAKSMSGADKKKINSLPTKKLTNAAISKKSTMVEPEISTVSISLDDL